MALIQTESSNLKRDTTNMALINHNVKAYEIHKNVQAKRIEKEEELNNMKNQIQELKSLLELALNTQQTN